MEMGSMFHASVALSPRKCSWYDFGRRFNGFQGRSGRCRDEKSLLSLSRINPRFHRIISQAVTCLLSTVAVRVLLQIRSYSGQSGTGLELLQLLWFPLKIHIPAAWHSAVIFFHRCYVTSKLIASLNNKLKKKMFLGYLSRSVISVPNETSEWLRKYYRNCGMKHWEFQKG
jgi:hypothetical protein